MSKQMKTYRYTNQELTTLLDAVRYMLDLGSAKNPSERDRLYGLVDKIGQDLAHRAKVAERNRTQPRPSQAGDVIPRETAATLYKLYSQKTPIRQIANQLELSYGTVYRFIQMLKRQQQLEAGLGGW